MENMINNPGIQHLAENIFLNLDVKCLKICLQINQYCKQILENPLFWLKKFNLSKENHEHWIKVIQLVDNSDKGIAIISYLQWNLKNLKKHEIFDFKKMSYGRRRKKNKAVFRFASND